MSMSNGVMGLFGLGVSAAGMAADSYAAYQQAKAQEAAAEWNAGMLEDNAKIKDLQAEQALQKGEHAVAWAKRDGAQKIESQRAAYAASGVKVDTGSALDVIAEQAGLNRYEQDMIQYDADMSAWGHKVEGVNMRQQAAMTRATKQSPGMALTTSVLSGGTSLFKQYAGYNERFGRA